MANAITSAIRIQAAPKRLPNGFVMLSRVIHPFARYAPDARRRAAFRELLPEQAIEIVRDQFFPLDPSLVTAAVHHLHELQTIPCDLTRRVVPLAITHTRVREDGDGVRLKAFDQGGQVIVVVEIVGGQVRDQRRASMIEAAVKRRANASIPR
jgi:hypothetical protein